MNPHTVEPYDYGISVGLAGDRLWRWQVDLGPFPVVLEWGLARSRRAAIRKAARRIRRHAR